MVKTRITANLVLVALLAALAVSLFADVIFTKEPKIAIPFYSEAFQNIIPFREFCSREMLSGRFPFWNPYLYCGSPVFSNPEMGILYLPNFLYLFFPSCKAFNLNVVFHVFLGAFFMYLWSARRGIKPLGRITASVVFMFGAPQILYASLGAYSNLQTLIWAPLVFMAVDGMVERPAFKWAMAGGLAVMMQIFAGHMQFTYYTGFLAVVYLMIKLCVPGKPILDKFHSAATFVIMYFLASALAAVQLYPGYLWHLGGVRAGGIPYMAAASCSLPPENLITMIAPGFFGDNVNFGYWGRWFFWETCMLASAGGLVLGIIGAIFGNKQKRSYCSLMFFISSVLALGSYTPVFKIAYDLIPGYAFFRADAKFAVFSVIFMAILAAAGVDRLLEASGPSKDPARKVPGGEKDIPFGATAVFLYFSGLMLLVLSSIIKAPFSVSVSNVWTKLILSISTEQRWPFFVQYRETLGFVQDAGAQAWNSLVFAAAIIFLLAAAFLIMKRSKAGVYAAVLVVLAEAVTFAGYHRHTTDVSEVRLNREISDIFAREPGDYRILWAVPGKDAEGMGKQLNSVWGVNQPEKRYAEFMLFTQGYDYSSPGGFLELKRYDPLYSMLRCRYAVFEKENDQPGLSKAGEAGGMYIYEAKKILPRVFLVENIRIARGREEVFRIFADVSFDPRKEVILEAPPDIDLSDKKLLGVPGEVKVEEASPGNITITARLDRPAVLVITDRYDEGWRVRDISSGVPKKDHRIVPADHVLMGIPLAKGEHHINLRYMPKGFEEGLAISLIFALGSLIWGIFALRAYMRRTLR